MTYDKFWLLDPDLTEQKVSLISFCESRQRRD